jgi:hypothetical protein
LATAKVNEGTIDTVDGICYEETALSNAVDEQCFKVANLWMQSSLAQRT